MFEIHLGLALSSRVAYAAFILGLSGWRVVIFGTRLHSRPGSSSALKHKEIQTLER